jgi:hypothetical protein
MRGSLFLLANQVAQSFSQGAVFCLARWNASAQNGAFEQFS